MSEKIRLLVVDKRELHRKAISTLLAGNGNFKVISDCDSCRHAAETLKSYLADVILLNTNLPQLEIKSLIELVQSRYNALRIILLNSKGDHREAPEYLTRGVNCFLDESISVSSLFNAINIVHKEGYYFDQMVSRALLGKVIKDKTNPLCDSEPEFNLRETEILVAICEGKKNKEIASELNLSTSTIDFYRTRIYSKARCSNVAALIRFSIQKGLYSFN